MVVGAICENSFNLVRRIFQSMKMNEVLLYNRKPGIMAKANDGAMKSFNAKFMSRDGLNNSNKLVKLKIGHLLCHKVFKLLQFTSWITFCTAIEKVPNVSHLSPMFVSLGEKDGVFKTGNKIKEVDASTRKILWG